MGELIPGALSFDHTFGPLLPTPGLCLSAAPQLVPLPSPLPSQMLGRQANSNVAFTGKQACQKPLSQDASVMEKAIEETQLCLVTLDLLF